MFVRAGSLDIHVQIDGPKGAAPLLLLHSLGTDHHIWDDPAETLRQSFRVIRPDLRGHGLSSVPPGPYFIGEMAQDMLALLDALDIRGAHVAGVSIGGMVAQAMAGAAPERVRGLVLVDTALAIPPAELWRGRAATARGEGMAPLVEAVVARWVTPAALNSPVAQGLRAMLRRTDPEGYAGAAEAIAAADLTGMTRTLRQPTLVLVGDGDVATPLASAEALRDAIPGARLEVIAGAAHIPMAEQPQAVTEAMLRFLAPAVEDPFAAGMAVRQEVLGEAHVARASAAVTALDAPFQDYITRSVWGGIWTRPGLPRHTRSLLTLAMMAALGREGEFVLHVRATRNTGVTPEEIAEVLLQVGAYAGVPAANHALKLAKQTLKQMEEES
ncbi:bifunctional 3-oxoadipate enol-lactonase/4-carboxymuconolactone decarboxylase PcaDC [Roseomonas marmotae]|uniref:3-oxoadipate enol-lactonase n=1 Tax=Roseomonas marmotae TaxID=2768161 RepID=A0ABS3KCE7_9PROT|nr:3-oxoadipate enol-lactonase [Roseomonas marmotae]MBO1074657.1 3-oxoadipate enol-lactonase [Roseomonas marmotae]QTI81676.1 3-oxoadipate enol-lactonase [Roseomonas marmotae]